MTMGTWALLGSAPSRSCEHRQVGKASDVSVQAGAGGQQAGSRNVRSGKSLLSANCRPNAQEIPQGANAGTETGWLKLPTAPLTRFKIKAQEMTFRFSPGRHCNSRLRIRPARELSLESSASLW